MTPRALVRAIRENFYGVEALFSIIILGGLAYCLWHMLTYNYLPQPFFYEPSDLFADWFNTAYWARDPGTYDAWQTIYLPISFIFLRIFGLDHCYTKYRPYTVYDLGPGLPARECDWLGMASLGAIFLINLFLVYRIFRKWDSRTAVSRTICLGLGLPMLDGLERGNLVLVSFAFLALALGPVLRHARTRWICAGLAINFKIYLIVPVVALLLKRKWRWVECALIATVAIYLASYAILGRGTPFELYDNIVYFVGQPAKQILDFWYSTTYVALVSLMEGDAFPFVGLIGSRNVDIALFAIAAMERLTAAILLAGMAGIWLRPEAASVYRTVNLAVLLVCVATEPGGYSMIYFMLFTLMEPWKGWLRITAIVCCYLLAIPLDIPVDQAPEVVRDTYVGATTVIVAFKVMIGPFIRPLLIMIIAICMGLLTVLEVWRDVRMQGWSSRWRYRRDAPLLPWIARPSMQSSARR